MLYADVFGFRSMEDFKRAYSEEFGVLIAQWGLDDIEADLAWCGRDGSPTKVHRIQAVVLAGGQYREFAATDEALAELAGELIEDHTIG